MAKGPEQQAIRDTHSQVRCLWFFIALPDPLEVPEGWQYGRLPSSLELLDTDGVTSGLTASLKFSHIDVEGGNCREPLIWKHAFEAVEASGYQPYEGLLQEALTSISLRPLRVTVVEAAVPIADRKVEDSLIERALDLAIETTQDVQLAVAMVVDEPLRLLTRTSLPPTIPVFEGRLFSHGSPAFDSCLIHSVRGSSTPRSLGVPAKTFDQRGLRKLHRAAATLGRMSAYLRYVDLRREAVVQRRVHGNARLALVALATAGEVLLDTTLLHLAWEEKLSPQEAALLMKPGIGHARRVDDNLPGRLGGDWDRDGNGPVGLYFQRLVYLRHRVVHAGHSPSVDEVDQAWKSLMDLEKHLSQRLLSKEILRRYPRTAMVWLGRERLRTKLGWRRAVKHVAKDRREPQWSQSFARYRRRVDQAIDRSPVLPGSNPDGLLGFIEVGPDGAISSFVHDPATGHIAFVDPSEMVSSELKEQVEQLVLNPASRERTRVLVSPQVGEPRDLPWLPEEDYLEEFTIYPGATS